MSEVKDALLWSHIAALKACEADLEALKASNAARAAVGDGPAYSAEHFQEIAREMRELAKDILEDAGWRGLR